MTRSPMTDDAASSASTSPVASRSKGLWLEGALALSILTLIGQLAWPSYLDWRERPQAGRIVARSAWLLARRAETRKLLPHWLYLPPAAVDAGRPPLLVYLHGSGERGFDLKMIEGEGPLALIKRGEAPPLAVAAPQCPPQQGWEPVQLWTLIEYLTATHRLDPDRIYITGFSMGGYGTWRLAADAPERLAAVAPVAGGGDPANAEKLLQLPIWAFHGARDEVVPVRATIDVADSLATLGRPIKLTIYEDRGHDVREMTYDNPQLYRWLLKHRRSALSATSKEIRQCSAEKKMLSP